MEFKLSSKRKLFQSEIDDIVSFIKPNPDIPSKISNAIIEQMRRELLVQLEKIYIYPSMIPRLKEQIEEQHRSSIIPAGESVGIITAQSIGEKQTQSNLNTFHKCGSSDKQPTSSKFAELLNATDKPKAPSYNIFFKEGNKSVRELRDTVNFSLVQLTLRKLMKEYEICIDYERDFWYDAYDLLYTPLESYYNSCIKLKIDMDILFEYRMKLHDIAKHIEKEYCDIACVFSPDHIGELHIYLDTRNIDIGDIGDLQEKSYITEENKTEIYLEEVVLPIIKNMIVCGIQGIMNIFFVEDKETKTWFIETENSNDRIIENNKFKKNKEKAVDSVKRYKKVLAHPSVMMEKTISNNIWDIYYTLGIEAVRQYMIDEFSNIMEGINKCHTTLLVDKMTFLGIISSISRYTMRRDDTGPLSKASFEETLDNLTKSAVFAQVENTKGISASIICGKKAPIGTGMCELVVDMKKL